MNWKNVLFLFRVERKSGRLIRGIKATRYRENGLYAYWPYLLAVVIGVLGGLLGNFVASAVYANTAVIPGGLPPLRLEAINIFSSFPTLVLIFCVVLTMLQQFQLSGTKASGQMIYWLPVTWQEHTLASILANLLGFPFGVVLGFASGIIVFAVFNGLIVLALLTTVALFASGFLASTTTEIIRILQTRFLGAVYKSSGKAAIWVRFAGSIFFFIVFYIIYFYITSGFTGFIQTFSQIQNSAWFVPFVWLALTVYNLISGFYLQGLLFLALSAAFIAGLYYLAVNLNMRFGLYEPPAIKLQKSGVYTPKTGFLGKLGFSTAEAALIRKDLRAFTRRRELMQIFIVPIVFIVLFLMQSISGAYGPSSSGVTGVFSVLLFLAPCTIMAMTLGNMLIGEEGHVVWRIYASPISPKSLVKSKFFIVLFFSLIVMLISMVVGVAFFHPSAGFVVISFLESLFLMLSLGSISLAIGFKGADFSASRRARMIRQEWALISFVVCAVVGLAVLAPLIIYVVFTSLFSFLNGVDFVYSFNFALPVLASGVIALILTVIFYTVNIRSAKELIRKAEV
jgi:hypothetical protein